MKWDVAFISDVADVNPRSFGDNGLSQSDLVTFVPMAAVSEKTVSVESAESKRYGDVSRGYTAFNRGDILVAKITPCFENGKMAITDLLPTKLGFGSTEFHVIRPSCDINGRYLFHILREPYIRLAGRTKMKGAAGQRRVPADFFLNLQIPLPPIDEQKRIAEILDKADALRAQRRQALEQLDKLLQSTFLDLFGDPVTNPKGWEVKKIGELVLDCKTWNPRRSSDNIAVSYIDLGSVDKNDKEIKHISTIDSHEAPSRARQIVKNGDILVATVRPNLNGVARVLDKHHEMTASTGFCVLRPSHEVLTPEYLFSWVRTDRFINDMLDVAIGANYPAVSDAKVKGASIPLPPLNLQKKFAKIVEKVEQQKAKMRQQLNDLDTLFAALQQRAFKGEL